ncbi:hypothetical protein NL529_30395, partial [Klebsiella pneumoniae]|nr:hypothetical protein [Klebsiella pneumoniae]
VPAAAAAATYAERVFDPAKLHRVDITIPDYNARNFTSRTAARQHGTLTFDGEMVRDVGVRQSGTFLPYVGIGQKPSLSIKFNEFVK